MSTIVFHTPYPIDPDARAASGIRPARMRDAFAEAGYAVREITGRAAERRAAFRELRRDVARGLAVEFLYSEGATLPTALTEPHRLPTHPLLEPGLLAWCKRQGIPTGLFYRDVYWRFPEYRTRVNPVVAVGTRTLYNADLLSYRLLVDALFLPSLRMGEHVPFVPECKQHALPPGCAVVDDEPTPAGHLRLLYIGALGSYYRMHAAVQGVAASHSATLTLCTGEALWEQTRVEYGPLLAGRTDVVHRSGSGLDPLYAAADICLLYVEPTPYREFAAPFKLFEYLGHGRPVIASEGTLSGDFVRDTGIGWTIPYETGALASLLDRLAEHPAEVERARQEARRRRHEHTWRARAEQVARVLVRAGAGRAQT